MFIDINDIGPDGVEIETALDLPDLEDAGGESLTVRSCTLTARLAQGKRGTEIRGRLDAVVQVQCSRCLKTLEEPVRAGYFLVAVPEAVEQPAPGEGEDPEEEAFLEARLKATDGKVDLNAVAAEQIYLNLSRKPVCSRDCRGLCPGCGVNRNSAECRCDHEEIDPRLAPLLKFRKN